MKNAVKILILLGYCVPFAFLGPWGDGMYRSLIGYLIMMAGFAILTTLAIRSGNRKLVLPGNLLSTASSVLCAGLFLAGEKEWYFKPFTATTLVIAVAVIALLIQWGIVRHAEQKENA